MDLVEFATASRVAIVAGKGGVGKTTMAAALARMAADAGLRVRVVELEGRSGIAHAFGRTDTLDYEEVSLYESGTGRVTARSVTPDDALVEYLADHGLRRVLRRLTSSGMIEVVSTAIPGLRDVLVLGKIKQLEREGGADLTIVDAPATGHAVTLLTSPKGLLESARGGPVRSQAADVVEMLADPTRTRVLLVTLPEEMPVSETLDAIERLTNGTEVSLGPIIVNALPAPTLPIDVVTCAEEAGISLSPEDAATLEAARHYRNFRSGVAMGQVAKIPGAWLGVPFLPSPSIGLEELGVLSRSLAEAVRNLPMKSRASVG